MAIVYKITNRISNKSYVGYTSRTLQQRWNAHLSSARQGSKFRFHSAIRKYGVDSWDLQILFEDESVDICKKKEEHFILEMNLTNNIAGYNAKPGGCGGWIVPNGKYKSWLSNNKERAKGVTNSNSTGYSNDELLNIAISIFIDMGRIIGHASLVEECKKRGLRFPKSFRPFRFDGKYENMIKLVEEKTGMIYDPFFRSEEQKKKIRDSLTGRVGHNKDTKVIIEEGKRKHVKN
jgi:hypothetical protein